VHPENPITGELKMMLIGELEVESWFTQNRNTGGETGLMVVHEYCISDEDLQTANQDELGWQHVYVIERYKNQCFMLMADQEHFDLSMYISPFQFHSKDESGEVTDREYNVMNWFRGVMGYRTEEASTAHGIDCQKLYKDYYRLSYPEVSAVEAYQKACINYRVHGSTTLNEEGLQQQRMFDTAAARQHENVILDAYRLMTIKQLFVCNDMRRYQWVKNGIMPGDIRAYPGRWIPIEFLFRGIDPSEEEEAEIAEAIAEAAGTPKAAVPKNIQFQEVPKNVQFEEEGGQGEEEAAIEEGGEGAAIEEAIAEEGGEEEAAIDPEDPEGPLDDMPPGPRKWKRMFLESNRWAREFEHIEGQPDVEEGRYGSMAAGGVHRHRCAALPMIPQVVPIRIPQVVPRN